MSNIGPGRDAEGALDDPGAFTREQLVKRSCTELVEATKMKTAVPPLRNRIVGMDLEDAYAIQDLQLQHHISNGRVLAGRKVGLTSLAMQEQIGVDSPDYGFFFKDMVYGDNAQIDTDSFIFPKVEPEFGFVLKQSLRGPNVTRKEAAEAIGEIYPALEIIDSRIADWDITLVDTVADNASCGAIAVGSDPLELTVDQLINTKCTLCIDGSEVASGTGKGVMGDPVAPVVWLANVLGAGGITLEAGQLILPGAFTKAMPVVKGSSAEADFGELGSLCIHFT